MFSLKICIAFPEIVQSGQLQQLLKVRVR